MPPAPQSRQRTWPEVPQVLHLISREFPFLKCFVSFPLPWHVLQDAVPVPEQLAQRTFPFAPHGSHGSVCSLAARSDGGVYANGSTVVADNLGVVDWRSRVGPLMVRTVRCAIS